MNGSAAIQSSFQRVEKKYFLTRHQYVALLEAASPYLRPDRYGRYTICSVYYDTEDYRLIRASLEKPVYKEKLRLRSYGVPRDGDTVFVELKKKFNGIVGKRRVVMEAQQAVDYLSGAAVPDDKTQISREIDWFLQSYHPSPKAFIAYDREALSGIEEPSLRVTFDTGLRWRTTELDLRLGDHGAPLLAEERILMEIKLPGAAAPLWLSHLLSELEIYPGSFSKYGTCYSREIMGRETPCPTKEVFTCA